MQLGTLLNHPVSVHPWCVAFLLFGSPLTATAASLSVSNASFEDITGQPPINEFTLAVPNGWTAYNPNNLVSGSGLYFGTLQETGAFFDAPPPDGSRVAILYNQTQKGAGEYGLQQTLVATLQPLTSYTLQVDVGNIGSGTAVNGDFFDLSGFPGYRIELLAGSSVLATDNNSLTIAERAFATSTIQYTTSANDPLLNQALTIRLVSLNNPFEADDNSAPYDAHEVDFDQVRLNAVAVPEPSSVGLVAVGLLATTGLLRLNRQHPK